MAALFLEQEITDGSQLLDVVLGNSSPDVDRSGNGSHFLQLGNLEAVSNLVDDESFRGDLLLKMEKCQTNSDGTVTQGRDEDGDPIPGGSPEDGSLIFDGAP